MPGGGFSIWIELDKGIVATELQRVALSKGIGICPLWTQRVDGALKKLGKIIKG